MGLFGLGERIDLERETGLPPQLAWERSRELLEAYTSMGYSVSFAEERAPERLVAEVVDREGTHIHATIDVTPLAGGGTRLELALRGRVHVGGMKGMLASEAQVQQVARERLEGLVRERFPAGETAPASPAPEPAAEEPAAEEPAREPAPEPDPARERLSMDELEEKLTLLKTLHDRGLISAEDVQRKKQELLERL